MLTNLMTFASQFHTYLLWGQRLFSIVRALVGTFNQEKALVGAFYVIVKTSPINCLQHYSMFTWACF